MGTLFEGYVEEQLSLLGQAANIIPEIESEKGRKTVDFFVVTPEALILVEVKANRPIWEARIGHPEGFLDFEKKVGHAQAQISNTSKLLDAQHPKLAHLPSGPSRVGLIITLEPFYGLQSTAYEQVFGATSLPIAVASSAELEDVVATLAGRADIGRRILDALTVTEPDACPVLTRAIEGLGPVSNSIIDAECERIDGTAGN